MSRPLRWSRPSRRDFMTALGLGSGGLFLPSLARAGSAPPRRFLLFYTAQGCVPDRWKCNPFGNPVDQDWQEDWTSWRADEFSDSLRSLQPWASRCSAVGGLGLVSAADDGSGKHHERMQAHGTTGAYAQWYDGIPYAGDMTLDQRIAEQIARPDRYPSIEASVGGGLAYEDYGSAIYRGPAQPLPAIDDPSELWERLFGYQAGRGDPMLEYQTSVLDHVADRYAALSQRLSGEDRRKLEVHQELIRDLEQMLLGVRTAECEGYPGMPYGSGDYQGDFETHLQLIASAFSCDMTRVASLQMGQLTPTQLGLPPGDMHNDYAHGIYISETNADAMTRYMDFHAQQFVRILEVLDSIPEGEGSLLDYTLVAWMSELADSWHGMDDYPVVLGGGAHCGIRLGQYLHHAALTPYETMQIVPDAYMGIPHQRLLITVCQAMGLDTQALGVTGIRGWDGSTIDCTGSIPGLLA